MVVFSIPSSPFPIEGDYAILWSSNASFGEGSYTILTQGNLPKGSYTVSVKFNIPETTYGSYYVQFYQVARDPITMQFMLRPAISVIPFSAKPGTKVTIKGSGFPAGDNGFITIKSETIDLTINTSSTGTFSISFTVPDIETGTHVITATTMRLGAERAKATLEVLPRNSEPPINPPPETPVENNNGTNNINNNTPLPPPIIKTKPPKPVIISPRNDSYGWFGKQSVTFKWGAVPEPKDVTYTLEIMEKIEGENFNFNPPLIEMQKTGLTSTTFTMDIPPGTYFWRVKAVDSQGNEGAWAYGAYAFKVGSFPVAPLIIGIVVIGVIVIFIKIMKAFKRDDDRYYYL